MSNYRDDVNEIAVLSDSIWSGLSDAAESTVRMSDRTMFGLFMLIKDDVSVADQAFGLATYLIEESASIQDAVVSHAVGRNLVRESVRARDSILSGMRTTVLESVSVSDEVSLRIRAGVTESVFISNEVLSHRISRTLVADLIRVSDSSPYRVRQLVSDAILSEGSASGRLRARNLVSDIATIADEPLSTSAGSSIRVVESARISGFGFGRLNARDVVSDLAVAVWDEPDQTGDDAGQAWTAPTGSWSMSRYTPFTFAGLSVIDGVPYGFSSDGVYALDGAEETIMAELQTGMIDMTGGVLCHPLQSVIAYELDGSAQVDVTQTQRGASQKYTYALPNQPALTQTSGRFQLGRGLVGRHFKYALRLTGKRAYISDWNVTAAPSKRSI